MSFEMSFIIYWEGNGLENSILAKTGLFMCVFCVSMVWRVQKRTERVCGGYLWRAKMNFDERNWVSWTIKVMSKSSLGCSLNADVTCWTHDVRAILHLSSVFRDI